MSAFANSHPSGGATHQFRLGWHTFRHTHRTLIDDVGTPLGVQQRLMRHSDIKLTLDTYTDSTLLRVSEAITALPSFGESATLCATNLGISRHDAAQAGTNATAEGKTKVIENQSIGHDLAQTDATCHLDEKRCLTRIRT